MSDKVLLVDDDPQFLEIFEAILSRHFNIQAASGPEQGLEILSSDNSFQVIVADLYMQPMDGIEFLYRAQKLVPAASGILITGHPSLDKIIQAVNKTRIFGIFAKSDPVSQLVSRIRQGIQASGPARPGKHSAKVSLSRDELIFLQTFPFSHSKE
ncbi:response regulator [Desulfonatronovibrio hydrogenovorans]|uniref:response regulator n=1 Tax=Desulfonatronovibrio hydrogenovorans TaxID=53245 RepID=UPI00048B7FA5|nr:response regulator [Desulfonatronovibrio hydrogenovorans]